jgi:type I restriction enzyme, R subunit
MFEEAFKNIEDARRKAAGCTTELDYTEQFDLLARAAYARGPLTRQEPADRAMTRISALFNSKQQVFLDVVLSHYASQGVDEFDQPKLTLLLRLKDHDPIADAVAELGRADAIGMALSRFRTHLDQEPV